jgi:hypothetical protein
MSALVHVRPHVANACAVSADSCHDPPQLIAPESQLTLFGDVARKVRRAPIRKKKSRSRGLQYRIRLTLRKTDRKIAFRSHFTEDEQGNDFDWQDEGIIRLHTKLLQDALTTLRDHCERGSPRAADIMAWVDRCKPDEPFSFETCCALFGGEDDDGEFGPFDPDILRCQLRARIRQVFNAVLPHADVLRKGIRAAEDGDTDAIEWVLSDSDAPLSFPSCCNALGFDSDLVRQEITLPNPLELDDGLDDVVQRAIDSAFGDSPITLAA